MLFGSRNVPKEKNLLTLYVTGEGNVDGAPPLLWAGRGEQGLCPWVRVSPWTSLWELRSPCQRSTGGMLPKPQGCAVCCGSSSLAPSYVAAKHHPGSTEALREGHLSGQQGFEDSVPAQCLGWPPATSVPHVSHPLDGVSKELLLK